MKTNIKFLFVGFVALSAINFGCSKVSGIVESVSNNINSGISSNTSAGVVNGRLVTQSGSAVAGQSLALVDTSSFSVSSIPKGSDFKAESVVLAASVATTNADGSFRFSQVPYGKYTLVASDLKSEIGYNKSIVVASSVSSQDIGAVALLLKGTLSGNIMLSKGLDYSGIDVFVPGTAYAAKTDEFGQFLLPVPEGKYVLYVSKPGFDVYRIPTSTVQAGTVTALDTITLTASAKAGNWLTGSADPGASIGDEGDAYFNKVSAKVFIKKRGVWVDQGSFLSYLGVSGSGGNWIVGTTTPNLNNEAQAASPGTLYLNSSSGEYFKKMGSEWTSQGNLKGSAGADGSAGVSVYVRFATDSNGTGFSSSPIGKTYVAFGSWRPGQLDPDEKNNFAGLWQKYVGSDGSQIPVPEVTLSGSGLAIQISGTSHLSGLRFVYSRTLFPDQYDAASSNVLTISNGQFSSPNARVTLAGNYVQVQARDSRNNYGLLSSPIDLRSLPRLYLGTVLSYPASLGSVRAKYIAGNIPDQGGATLFIFDSGDSKIYNTNLKTESSISWAVSHNMKGIAYDRLSDKVVTLLSSGSGGEIVAYNMDGSQIKASYTAQNGSADGNLISPIDVQTDSSGNVYVLDSGRNDISVFKRVDTDYVFLRKLDGTGFSQGVRFTQPVKMLIASVGGAAEAVYVLDQGTGCIYACNLDSGVVENTLLGPGSTDSTLSHPTWVGFESGSGTFAVRDGSFIKLFNSDGTFNSKISISGLDLNAGLYLGGALYMCDAESAFIRKIDTITSMPVLLNP